MNQITFQTEKEINVEQFIAVLERSPLAERRPVDDWEAMQAMLDHGDIIVTAWDGEILVGIATVLTDFHRVAYLADLAVDEAYQRCGIGKELIERARAELSPSCSVVLLASPAANDFYPRIGFEHNPRAWTISG